MIYCIKLQFKCFVYKFCDYEIQEVYRRHHSHGRLINARPRALILNNHREGNFYLE